MTFSEILLQHYGNFIAAGFLLILLFVIVLTNSILTFRSKLFLLIIIFNITENIMEPLAFASENRSLTFFNLMAFTLMFVIFLFAPIVAGLFGSYIDYLVHQSRDRLKKRLYYMQPALLIGLLLVINIFYPVIYSYDRQGVYSREFLYNIMFGAITLMYLYILIMAAKYQNQLHSKIVLGSSIYLFGPVIAALFQLYLFPNTLLIHPAVAMATVFAYLLFESNNGSVEPFTKLMTRERITQAVDDLISDNKEFTLVMFDINKFKEINDNYGHEAGDSALLFFTRALVHVYGKKSYISRWGGDEFLVCMDTVARIHVTLFEQNLKDFLQDKNTFEFDPIAFSMGFVIRDEGNERSSGQLIQAADKQMYKNKFNRLNRRRTDR